MSLGAELLSSYKQKVLIAKAAFDEVDKTPEVSDSAAIFALSFQLSDAKTELPYL